MDYLTQPAENFTAREELRDGVLRVQLDDFVAADRYWRTREFLNRMDYLLAVRLEVWVGNFPYLDEAVDSSLIEFMSRSRDQSSPVN